jgi:hypothetical protein
VSEYAFQATLTGPDQGREVVRGQLLPFIGKLIDAGKRVAVTAMEEEDSKSIRQRKYYHRYVLFEIAEQAKVNGEKFAMPVWKEHFRELYVGSTWKVYKDPMTGRKKRRKVRISTEDLSVKAYSKLIDQVTSFAATELNVTFSVPNWESYRE